MNKRTTLLLLLAVAVLLIAGVLYWMFGGKTGPVQQPPAPQPTGGVPAETSVPFTTSTNRGMTDAEKERQAQEAIKRQAMILGSRLGTYGNADAFVAIKTVYVDATSDVQAYLESIRVRLDREHPIKSGAWGQTTKALSARIDSGFPVLTSRAVDVIVQTQKVVESAGVADVVTYEEAKLSFVKQGSLWVLSRVSWQAYQP